MALHAVRCAVDGVIIVAVVEVHPREIAPRFLGGAHLVARVPEQQRDVEGRGDRVDDVLVLEDVEVVLGVGRREGRVSGGDVEVLLGLGRSGGKAAAVGRRVWGKGAVVWEAMPHLVSVLDEGIALDARVRLREHRDEHVDKHDVGDQNVDPHEGQTKWDARELIQVEFRKHGPKRLPDQSELYLRRLNRRLLTRGKVLTDQIAGVEDVRGGGGGVGEHAAAEAKLTTPPRYLLAAAASSSGKGWVVVVFSKETAAVEEARVVGEVRLVRRCL